MQFPCSFEDYIRLMYWLPHLEKLTPDPEDKASLRQISMFLGNGGPSAADNHFLKLNPRQFRALLGAFQRYGSAIPDSGGEEAASNVCSYTRYLEAIERGENPAPPDYLGEYRREQGLPPEELEEEEDVPEVP